MKEIVIQIPALEAEQNVEIDVKVNGRKKTIKYRVEIVEWEPEIDNTEEKITMLQRVIKEKSDGWELVQIGAPTDHHIPVMFRQRGREDNE